MKRFARFFSRFCLLLMLCPVAPVRAYTPPPPDPPELKEFAARVVAAPDDAARDRLLAEAPAGLRDHPQIGHALNKAWGPIIYTGDYERAGKLGLYVRRLLLARGKAVDAANSLYLLGTIDGSRGDNQAAMEKFEAARPVFEQADDKERLATVLAGQGIIHLQLGDYRQALADTRRSLELYRETGYREGIVAEMNTLGSIFMDQGLTDRAMDQWQETLAFVGDDPDWQMYLFPNVGNVHWQRGEHAKAIDLIERSAALAEKADDKPRAARAIQAAGEIYLSTGRLDRAEERLQRALKIGDEIGDKRRQTAAMRALSELRWQQGGTGAAREALGLADRASVVARETGEPLFIWTSRTLAGQLHEELGELDQAKAAFEEAIEVIEDARLHLTGGDENAAAFFEDKTNAYQELAALLVRQGHPLEGLAMAERAKARVLLEICRSSKLEPGQRMTAEERTRTRTLAEAVAAASREVSAARAANPAPDAAKLAELEGSLARARQARGDAENDFFTAHPDLRRRLPNGAPLTADMLDGLVADGKTALLEYVLTGKRAMLFVVTRGEKNAGTPNVRTFSLNVDPGKLKERVQRFRAALANRSLGWQADATSLGEDLLAPLREACPDMEKLVVVPDGPLWELPFQALLTDGKQAKKPRTLWEKAALGFTPSLTFLAGIRQTGRSKDAGREGKPPALLVCANPARSEGVNPAAATATKSAAENGVLMDDERTALPDAERQGEALAKLYGAERSRVLIGEDARENEFKKLAGDCDVIHFATHGFLNDSAPMYSRLLMSQRSLAPDEDGFLEAWEWMPLRVRARLAVLSACETGRGRVGAGEGILGLSWAIFSAGCPATVVSQWKVDSASTTELMIPFHRQLLAGEEPASALRAAALELAKNPQYRHPFYWAPFVLIGAGEAITAK